MEKLIKHLFLILLITFSTENISYAQEIKKHSLYLEGLGNGVLYSINYDRIIPLNNHFKLAPRIGIEYIPSFNKDSGFGRNYKNLHIPLELNLLIIKSNESKNIAEIGLGLNLFSMNNYYVYNEKSNIVEEKNKMAIVTTFRLGYRYQKPQGGLMYRAGLLVKLTQDDFSKRRGGDDLFYVLWPGFSIGYTF